MNAHVTAIVNEVADLADDLLEGLGRNEAKGAILEYLQDNHDGLTAGDQSAVVAGVLDILDDEGFFEAEAGSDWSGGEDEAEGAVREE